VNTGSTTATLAERRQWSTAQHISVLDAHTVNSDAQNVVDPLLGDEGGWTPTSKNTVDNITITIHTAANNMLLNPHPSMPMTHVLQL